ncbi:hypothetical protein Peur_006187 [Populus x canadensis]
MGGFPAHLDSPMVDGYGKLLTNGLRFHKRLSMNPCLLDCAQIKENMIHVFRDCWRARTIWERLVDQDKWVGFSQALERTPKWALNGTAPLQHYEPTNVRRQRNKKKSPRASFIRASSQTLSSLSPSLHFNTFASVSYEAFASHWPPHATHIFFQQF